VKGSSSNAWTQQSEIHIRQTPQQLRRRQYRRVGFRLFLLAVLLIAVAWGLITSGHQASTSFYAQTLTKVLRYVLGPIAIALLAGLLAYKANAVRRSRHEYSMIGLTPAPQREPQNTQQQFSGVLDTEQHKYDTWEIEAVADAELSVSVGVIPALGQEFPHPTFVDLYIEKPDKTAYHNGGVSGAYLSTVCSTTGVYRVILTSSMARQMGYVLMISYVEAPSAQPQLVS